MSLRLGIVLADETLLRAAREDDAVDVVLLRSTFINPPRGAATRRLGERVRELHPQAELIPYAWHYLTHEVGDGIDVGSNRSLEAKPGSYGHFRSTPEVEQAWEITRICAQSLDAHRVVVRTPTSFSPGTLSRRRLTNFVASRSPEDPKLLWEPVGLWEPAAAAAFAAPLGVEVIAPAFGMTGQLLDFGEARWLLISGGKDARLRSSHAEILAYAVEDLDEEDEDGEDESSDQAHLTLLFDGPRAYTNLRAFVAAREI
ncbi:MAG: hypothetical protein KC431_00635 [Myxococcales bacterium]|nr:hypothetical protein [Myxococcales bacterium]